MTLSEPCHCGIVVVSVDCKSTTKDLRRTVIFLIPKTPRKFSTSSVSCSMKHEWSTVFRSVTSGPYFCTVSCVFGRTSPRATGSDPVKVVILLITIITRYGVTYFILKYPSVNIFTYLFIYSKRSVVRLITDILLSTDIFLFHLMFSLNHW